MVVNDGFDEHGIDLVHHFGGGVYAKETRIPAGKVLSQHRHRYAHLSILAVGRARVTADGQTREIEGPACLTIPAGVEHKVESVTAVAWFCIHRTDVTDPDVVDADLVEAAP